jgi:hypothetical protein
MRMAGFDDNISHLIVANVKPREKASLTVEEGRIAIFSRIQLASIDV